MSIEIDISVSNNLIIFRIEFTMNFIQAPEAIASFTMTNYSNAIICSDVVNKFPSFF